MPEEPLPAAETATDAPPATPPAAGAPAVLRRWPWLAAVAVLLLLAGLAAIVYTLLARDTRPLYPNLPTFTPLASTIEGEPSLIGFAELNEDPDAFRDRRIQVSGNFASVEAPTCVPHAGPIIRWSLVDEELQLNAAGFENVLRLIEEGTPMTVSGIWRLYQGPAGCGKEPADGNVWFLEVDQIIEPNPLFGEGGVALTVEAGGPLATLPPLDLSTPTLEATPTLTATLEAAPTDGVLPTFAPPTAVLPSPTLATGTPTATTSATPTATTGPSPTLGTPPTPTQTGTPGPSPTPSPTGSAGQTTPGIPTATLSGGGYPVESPTSELYP